MITHTSTALQNKAPTLWVCIDDYKIPVAVPTLDMTERFLEKAKAVSELQNGLTKTAYDDIFDFFAEVLSCNHNYIRYTAEELKQKNITVDQIVGVLADWAVFMGRLADLKN
jgi:hypothetical protein